MTRSRLVGLVLVGIVAAGCTPDGGPGVGEPTLTATPPAGGTRPTYTVPPTDSVGTTAPPQTTFTAPGTGPSVTPTVGEDGQRKVAEKELRDGLVAYNPPETATVHEEFQVTARVQRGTTPRPSLTQLPGTATPTMDPVRVGLYMRAHLGGAGFKTPELIGEIRQPLLEDTEFAEWTWKVEATEAGERQLILDLYVEAKDGSPLGRRTFHKPIDVVVVEQSFLSQLFGWSGWNEVATAVLIALLVTGVPALVTKVVKARRTRTRRRRRPARSRQPAPPSAGATTATRPAQAATVSKPRRSAPPSPDPSTPDKPPSSDPPKPAAPPPAPPSHRQH